MVSEICARLLADVRRRGRARAGRGVRGEGVRGRDRLHRHGERLLARRGRGVPRRGARRPAARLVRSRHEALLADARRRPRPLARPGPHAARRLAAPAPHRLRRPLPVPPLRLEHAARGDDGGADRSRPAGQGALPRLQRVARGEDPRGSGDARGRALRLEPAAVLDALAWPGARRHPRSPASSASRRSSGRRSLRASSPGSTSRGEPLPEGTRATSEAMGGFMDRARDQTAARARAAAAPGRRRARTVDGPARARLGAAGGERRRGDHRRAAGPSRSRTTPAPPASSSMPRRWRGSTRSSATASLRAADAAR